ncbi:MAG: sugar transferase [Armatimonadota bacterium]|nr:sugar transferase [Armatimonadota bacterium]MCX7777027.1 sugar transferase [Armatimonadota bacterium]MDW8024905.1 sugar transferase [Armatimonadota bacterium]
MGNVVTVDEELIADRTNTVKSRDSCFRSSFQNLNSLAYECIKRLIDVVGSLLLLFISMPFMILIGILIMLDSPGPILFRQPRYGKGGKVFILYKFRTMHVGAEKLRASLWAMSDMRGGFKLRNDPRVTLLGKFLRTYSLDELPQLFNVFKGEMSLVGPRPHPLDEFDPSNPDHREILSVKPGLTCLWQVSGRNLLSFEDWVKLDLQYVRNRSLLLDLAILGKTIPTVITAYGAF